MKKVIETKKEVVKERQYQFTCDVCGKESTPSTNEYQFCEFDISGYYYTPILKSSRYYGGEDEDFGDEIALCYKCSCMIPEALIEIRSKRIEGNQE